METLVLIGVAAGIGTVFWLLFSKSRRAGKRTVSFALQPGVSITSTPLLTEKQISFYNLIRIVVQDHYLVLAQVPLWAFVSVEAMGRVKSDVLKHMALKRVDYVLVHPGTRQVERVVQIDDEPSDHPQHEKQRIIESVLDAAGIKLVTVRSEKSYTTRDLTALLGLTAEDE